jgi:magnesium-transporting ATPase (P-type)
MDEQVQGKEPRPLVWPGLILAALAALAAAAAGLWHFIQERRRLAARRPAPRAPIIPVEGLTEAEAEARQVEGQDNVIQLKPHRTRKEIWRANVYNIFNLSLVGLAIAQLLLGKPLDALLSVATIGLNVGINVFQEMFARKRLEDIKQVTRPKVTVVREEKVRSIDPREIVVGDAIVLGPGDQILVDGELIGQGQIMVDESVITGGSARQIKRPGDKVLAGSYCLSGRAACLVEKTGSERLITSRLADAPAVEEQLTTIELLIQRILRVLLIVVAIFTVFIMVRYFQWDSTLVPVDAFNEVVSLAFNVAPVTLFFMIVVTYAGGTADLGRLGALVHRARSVESLAQANVICFAQAGILAGTRVEIESVEPPEGQESLSESRLRQMLGDFARTSTVDSLAVRAIRETFEGNRRVPVEEAPFLSVYGWSAISFDDDDLRGVYVLAEPEILEAYLYAQDGEMPEVEDEGEEGSAVDAVRRAVAPLGRLFGRGKEEPDEDDAIPVEPEPSGTRTSLAHAEAPGSETATLHAELEHSPDENPVDNGQRGHEGGAPESDPALKDDTQPDEKENGEDTGVRGFFRGLGKRVSTVLRRDDSDEDADDAPEKDPIEEIRLSFAYLPDLAAVHDAEGTPHLPEGLTPLCTLQYSQRIRPESVETVRTFIDTGVDIKVFTAEETDQMVRMSEQAGLAADDGLSLESISGPELAELDAGELKKAVEERTIFGLLTSDQAGQVVATLRQAGEAVAVVGDAVGDLPPMRQADLAISRLSSTQAALSIADIILLEDSPSVLGVVLRKGQRIVNGLLDILKLQLTYVVYLAILLVAVPLFSKGYPYRSGQGTVITVVTVAIPSLGLTLGAAAGVLPSARLGRLLFRFVLPAAITISVAGLLVYMLFLDRSGQVAYAQLGLTYTLVACGLGLVVFIKPPRPAAWSGGAQKGAWWPLILAPALMALFVLVCAIPLAQDLLHIGLLQEPTDYAIVAVAFLAWAITLRFVLFLIPVARDE